MTKTRKIYKSKSPKKGGYITKSKKRSYHIYKKSKYSKRDLTDSKKDIKSKV